MAQPYSLDLRQRAVAAVKAGTARLEVQRLFRVARSTLARWVRCERAGGSLKPKKGKPGFVGQFEDARRWRACTANSKAARTNDFPTTAAAGKKPPASL